jgi:hypothetical protein
MLCVRGERLAPPQWATMSPTSNISTERISQLMITRDPQSGTVEQAVIGCRELELDGYRDWRLPNIREAHMLLDLRESNGFPADVLSGNFIETWSSSLGSSTLQSGARAIFLRSAFGAVEGISTSSNSGATKRYLCVRGGNPVPILSEPNFDTGVPVDTGVALETDDVADTDDLTDTADTDLDTFNTDDGSIGIDTFDSNFDDDTDTDNIGIDTFDGSIGIDTFDTFDGSIGIDTFDTNFGDDTDTGAPADTALPTPSWTFADTRQSECYNGGVLISIGLCRASPYRGQDGHHIGVPMEFTDLRNGTFRDENTPLIWESYTGAVANWYEASGTFDATHNPSRTDVCGQANTGGHEDWRLPTTRELFTVMQYATRRRGLAIELSNTTTPLWTSQVSPRQIGQAVSFTEDGEIPNRASATTLDLGVLCVRGLSL